VYAALEEAAAASCDDPHFGAVHRPEELNREAALDQDLEFFFGAGWRDLPECAPSEAARRYVARVREVAATAPALLISHSYTRYMGDLSGGRVLMRVAAKTYGLDVHTGDGVKFYKFDNVGNPKTFKNGYRAALDSLHIDADLSLALVDEANAAFQHNIDLFHHLDSLLGLDQVPAEKVPAGECPFGFVSKPSNLPPKPTANTAALAARAAAPGSTTSEIAISNCPVHLSFYTGRLRLLGARLIGPAGVAARLPAPLAVFVRNPRLTVSALAAVLALVWLPLAAATPSILPVHESVLQ